MLELSYNLSIYLQSTINKIHNKRTEILLFPLPVKTELKIQFDATLTRIEKGLSLDGVEVRRSEIIHTLSRQKDTFTKVQQRILGYKQAMDYIHQHWLASGEIFDILMFDRLSHIASREKLKISEAETNRILNYLQAASDSPIVQAAIAKLVLMNLLETRSNRETISTLCSYLYLYKAGLNMRGLLMLEKIWSDQKENYLFKYNEALKNNNLTSWLEYFAGALEEQLAEIHDELKKSSKLLIVKDQSPSFSELNDRQIAILRMLDNPQAILTNKIVQRAFRVSQITSSRDLSKLATLGLLFVHGKGRSVRYTKA